MSLEVSELTKTYDGERVLDEVSCHLPVGEISSILGASGCGKTTLLRLIAGLEPPDAGRILWNGADITALAPGRRDMALVFQNGGFYGHLSATENLKLALIGGHGTARRGDDIDSIARRFGIHRQLANRADTLSGGEGQRLAVARALIRNPKVTLLDEPFSNLDAVLQRELRSFVFERLRELSSTAVLVTHDHQDAQAADGAVVLLEQGRLLQIDSWEAIYRRPANPYAAQLVAFLDPVRLSGRLHRTADALQVKVGELDLPFPAELLHPDTPPESPVELYYRPEDLVPTDRHDPKRSIPGTAGKCFYQGGGLFCPLYRPNGEQLTFRCASGIRPNRGENLWIDPAGAVPVLLWSTGTDAQIAQVA